MCHLKESLPSAGPLAIAVHVAWTDHFIGENFAVRFIVSAKEVDDRGGKETIDVPDRS
jgi:hypothetical protein